MRTAQIKRTTAETDISLTLNLDGTGLSNCRTGCGFLDHMLTLFAKHGRFDLDVTCVGDTHVDYHHTVEDVGICLGKAFAQCLGEKRGIHRYGDSTIRYTLRVWTKTEDYWDVKNAIMLNIKDIFDAQGIKMVYPHVHVYTEK